MLSLHIIKLDLNIVLRPRVVLVISLNFQVLSYLHRTAASY